jgi:hypothetical protein
MPTTTKITALLLITLTAPLAGCDNNYGELVRNFKGDLVRKEDAEKGRPAEMEPAPERDSDFGGSDSDSRDD